MFTKTKYIFKVKRRLSRVMHLHDIIDTINFQIQSNCTNAHMSAFMRVYICTNVRTYICMHICIYVYMRKCTYTRTFSN